MMIFLLRNLIYRELNELQKNMKELPIEDYCYFQSPIGLIRISENKGFLTRTDFVENKPESEYFLSVSATSTLLNEACSQLDEYFHGIRQKFNLPLKPKGTFFQRSAWNSLLHIPFGETRTYLQQAESINNPNATRAIGQANSRNPISIIIPCHRVIRKNGFISGYSGGTERKMRLISMEGRFMHG